MNDGGGPAWFWFGRAVLLTAADAVATREADGEPTLAGAAPTDLLESARAAFHESLGVADLFTVVAGNAGLTVEDAEVLAVLAAAASDRACRDLVASLHGDGARGLPSLGLLAQICRHLDPEPIDGSRHPGVLTVRHDAPLVRHCLVAVEQDGPWTDHRVRLHPSVVWALVGDESSDADLPDGTTHLDEVADHGDSRSDFVVVNGPDRLRRRAVGAASAVGQRFLCAPMPNDDREWSALVREATLTGRGLIIDVNGPIDGVARRVIERADHLAWVLSATSGPPVEEMPRRPWTDVWAPGAEPSDDEWSEAFGPDVERTHRLTLDQLHRVGRAFRRDDDPQRALDHAVRRLASGDLERLTTRTRPTRGWEDVIVSEDRRALLHDLVDRYRRDHRVYDEWGFRPNPSRGLVALFSGPSGTGKTLAAEIVAGELGLDLFKLDLSSVVSKYIGETEQNLDRIFDAASAGNVVLFFDEADSLFGKRSEVRDARDRYANIEVSYLLQRLETYDGLVVMATNFEKNVDEAFLRRIHVRVPFTMPGPLEREQIWRQNLPGEAPVDDVDLPWLAERFELSGAAIRNSALQGAFLAARDEEPIQMRHLVVGIARELRKMGRLLNTADFGDYASLVTD